MMQTDNHHFKLNITNDKKYILRKMGGKFKTLFSSLAFSLFFVMYFLLFFVMNPLELRSQWDDSKK